MKKELSMLIDYKKNLRVYPYRSLFSFFWGTEYVSHLHVIMGGLIKR